MTWMLFEDDQWYDVEDDEPAAPAEECPVCGGSGGGDPPMHCSACRGTGELKQ